MELTCVVGMGKDLYLHGRFQRKEGQQSRAPAAFEEPREERRVKIEPKESLLVILEMIIGIVQLSGPYYHSKHT